MSFPRPRLVRILPGILAPLLACSAARAQIYDQLRDKPTPGLEEGVLLDVDGTALGTARVLKEPVGDKDFSIALDVRINDLTDAVLYADGDWGMGWGIRLKSDGAVEFNGRGAAIITTPPHVVKPHARACVVASIKRDARQAESGIWINGTETASGAVPPVAAGGVFTCQCDASKVASIHLRVYNRALTRPEILELCLRSGRREEAQASAPASPPNAQNSEPPHVSFDNASPEPFPKHAAPPPNGPRFIPQQDETIALIGGTEAVVLAESGELEARLLMAFPQTRIHFRSLAWEGDTVFKQDRPMNFGPLEQQLRRVHAGAVFVMFGRQECLEAAQAAGAASPGHADGKGLATPSPNGPAGAPGLVEFKAAFEQLLATVEKVTPNIVVFGPPPFEKKQPPLPDLSGRNSTLVDYSIVLREVAAERGATFANPVEEPGAIDSDAWSGATTDGVLLTPEGCYWTAFGIGETLRISKALDYLNEIDGSSKNLKQLIQTKNRLWHNYWRPSNWAFLHGDRTQQPSSRDPVNPQIRFFPAEQEKYPPLIKEAEDKVFQLVQEAQKKLP